MRYSRALKVSIQKKVMPPESRSETEVSRETGINYQTIKNLVKQYETGTFDDASTESCPRFLTAKEKYQLLFDAAGLKEDERGGFLRERGIHSTSVFWMLADEAGPARPKAQGQPEMSAVPDA